MKEKYNKFIEELSAKSDIIKELEISLKDQSSIGWEIINNWDSIFTDSDFSSCNAYLSTGLFSGYNADVRRRCFYIVADAEYLRGLAEEKRLNEVYEKSANVFKEFPELWADCKNEKLVNYRKIIREKGSNIFSIGIKHTKKWGYLDPQIPISLLSWIDGEYKNQPCYIRIDADSIFDKKPKQLLSEVIMHPPNPNWWKELEIYRGGKEKCSFELLGNDPCDSQDYVDFNVKNIRKLQVLAERKDEGNLSMRLEELEERENIIGSSKRYVIGRMIHLDTDDKVGTSFSDSTLNHIDIACYLYNEQFADERLRDNIGNKTQPTARTHLLRLEKVPFSCIFGIAACFFKSKKLFLEWINAQFKKDFTLNGKGSKS